MKSYYYVKVAQNKKSTFTEHVLLSNSYESHIFFDLMLFKMSFFLKQFDNSIFNSYTSGICNSRLVEGTFP